MTIRAREVVAEALRLMAAEPAERTSNPSSVWIDPAARRAVLALSEAGFDVADPVRGRRRLADAAWADLLLAVYDEHGAITPKVGAALSRYRATIGRAFYVGSTSAWHTLADRHLSDGGATGALACALDTLIDAYEHARSETAKQTGDDQ